MLSCLKAVKEMVGTHLPDAISWVEICLYGRTNRLLDSHCQRLIRGRLRRIPEQNNERASSEMEYLRYRMRCICIFNSISFLHLSSIILA